MKVYVNVSPTAKYGGNTGIQRVVRELCNVLDNKEFYGLNFKFIVFVSPDTWINYSDYSSYLKLIDAQWSNKILRIMKSPINKYLPKAIRHQIGCINLKIKKYSAEKKYLLSNKIFDNAVLVNLDAGWIDDWQYLQSLKLPQIQVIYDIIPITHPQFCSSAHIKNFSTWLYRAIGSSIAIISISKSAMKDIEVFTIREGFRNLIYKYFYLGADFDAISNRDIQPKNISINNQYFIAVGSIEPRKNHATLLNAFHEYKSHGGNWDLIIVGRASDHTSEVLKAIKNSVHFGTNLHWVNDASDIQLDAYYRSAGAVIVPSFVEGFGLPLIEALHYGKPVIASDIAVFREIGGNSVIYFPVQASDILAKNMLEISSGVTVKPQLQALDIKYLNWSESGSMFAKVISEIIDKKGYRRVTHYS